LAERLEGRRLAGVSEDDNQRVVERLISALNAGRVEEMDELFHDDAVMEYPQSGERIVGAENRRGVYGNFPGLPNISPRELRAVGDLVVAEATLTYGGDARYESVFVFELRDGRIARETAYWAEPFEAPDWRAQWVERSR
jgi:ketosteroid isomerase-like protein